MIIRKSVVEDQQHEHDDGAQFAHQVREGVEPSGFGHGTGSGANEAGWDGDSAESRGLVNGCPLEGTYHIALVATSKADAHPALSASPAISGMRGFGEGGRVDEGYGQVLPPF